MKGGHRENLKLEKYAEATQFKTLRNVKFLILILRAVRIHENFKEREYGLIYILRDLI